ncbi:hypothetical protein BpHYR1_008455 [Brachionus plicatilis]|uniref:Uncharacterized protein n=1 Tax=Brachionus plicatilis TaxID=10195 RepID=A0A3M7QKZ0_BRAPC|nr:hypothetical protein BpHYR1_008455 [Brachionus plicatilis]
MERKRKTAEKEFCIFKCIISENEEVRNLFKLPQYWPFFQYIEDGYVSKHVKEKVGRGRGKEILIFKEPLFSVKLWNVHSHVKCMHRNNNSVENLVFYFDYINFLCNIPENKKNSSNLFSYQN